MQFSKYKHTYYDNVKVTNIGLSTITRFYPLKNFIIGPSFNWDYRKFKDDDFRNSYQELNFGINLGFSININKRVVPYFIADPKFSLAVEALL